MSSIKTTHIDGDVSVGRNVAVGGGATVQGDSLLKGNVRVEGWLDADNIRGANKGVFTSVEKLKSAYPRPCDGWWAIVGTSLPGPVYVGDSGEWVPTGGSGGNPTVDGGQSDGCVCDSYRTYSMAQLDALNTCVVPLVGYISYPVCGVVTQYMNWESALQDRVLTQRLTVPASLEAVNGNSYPAGHTTLNTFERTCTWGGEWGPWRTAPAPASPVLRWSGDTVPVGTTISALSTASEGDVVLVADDDGTPHGFALRVLSGLTTAYYNNWPERERYQDGLADGTASASVSYRASTFYVSPRDLRMGAADGSLETLVTLPETQEADIPEATEEQAGLMSAADKQKLEGIRAPYTVDVTKATVAATVKNLFAGGWQDIYVTGNPGASGTMAGLFEVDDGAVAYIHDGTLGHLTQDDLRQGAWGYVHVLLHFGGNAAMPVCSVAFMADFQENGAVLGGSLAGVLDTDTGKISLNGLLAAKPS